MPNTNVVGWFEIYVTEMDRARSFYETVLEQKLEHMPTPPDSTMQMMNFPMDETMSKYGAPGALVQMEGVSPGVGGTMVYFAVANCATEESRVVNAGGSVVKPKESLGEFGFMSLCTDTEGNMFGLHSME